MNMQEGKKAYRPDLPMTIRIEHLAESPRGKSVIKPEYQGEYPKEFVKLNSDALKRAYPTYIEHWDGRWILLPKDSWRTLAPRLNAAAQGWLLGQKIRHRHTFPYLILEMTPRFPRNNGG